MALVRFIGLFSGKCIPLWAEETSLQERDVIDLPGRGSR